MQLEKNASAITVKARRASSSKTLASEKVAEAIELLAQNKTAFEVKLNAKDFDINANEKDAISWTIVKAIRNFIRENHASQYQIAEVKQYDKKETYTRASVLLIALQDKARLQAVSDKSSK